MQGTLESTAKIVPAKHAFPITPNNNADLICPTRGIYIGTFGDLRVRMLSGVDITFPGLAAGVAHPLEVIRVFVTGTTADEIRGMR